MTRSQRLLGSALNDVQSVQGHPERTQKAYGSLCHRLPALVRRNGLCQALAYLDAKNDEAHRLLLDHLASQLGLPRPELLRRVGQALLPLYMHQTRTVLSALIY